MPTNTFAGEIAPVCTCCGGELHRTPGPYTFGSYEHATAPADGHTATPRHQCATCKGDPYYIAAAYGDVIGCHHCGTRSFHSIGD